MKNFVKLLYRKIFPYKPHPEEDYNSFVNYWDGRQYPRVADIETTNICNAHCLSCLYDKATRPKGIMSLESFKWIADKLKEHKVPIRGMYTTGEPLIDPTLFEKYAYAREIKNMVYSDLNTNVSLLTPEKYDKILDHTDNITLSFFNIGNEFERLTGGLNWNRCYKNAIDFIKYRDKHRPDYRIFIGCNPVKGSNLEAVKKAFKDYNVEWAIDAELRWAGKVITGVIDRAIMHPSFRCDGHLGALKIKWDGSCEICAYDFFQETEFANIFTDNWDEIERKFKEGWKKPFSLCARCDYWHLYWRVKKNHFKYVEDYRWQKPFLDGGEEPQR